MAVYTFEINEFVFFRESTRKNLNTANISESLFLRYRLRSNIKQFNIIEQIGLTEHASKSAGVTHQNIHDILDFSELLHPRVYLGNCGDTVAIVEKPVWQTDSHHLNLTETLTFVLSKTKHETLVLVELATYRIRKNAIISETLGLSEGCSGLVANLDRGQQVPTSIRCEIINPLTREVPAGLPDGSNIHFTLSRAPQTGTFIVWINDQLITDYTIDANIVTFNIPPDLDARILTYYIGSGPILVSGLLISPSGRLRQGSGILLI